MLSQLVACLFTSSPVSKHTWYSTFSSTSSRRVYFSIGDTEYLWTVVPNMQRFNDHAQGKLNQKIKDALDPKGILSPGKNGVWPSCYNAEEWRVTAEEAV